VEGDPTAEHLLRQLGVGPDETPVVVWRDRVLRNPSNAELAQLVGLTTVRGGESTCDLLVVGAGPAGLAAAVYGASEGLMTVAVEGRPPLMLRPPNQGYLQSAMYAAGQSSELPQQ
jgi:thioredoxin reductase (NADPH)